MGGKKPKVLMVEGDKDVTEAIAEVLSKGCDVRRTVAATEPAIIESDEIDAVIFPNGSLPPDVSDASTARILVDAISEGVCLADREGVLLWTNAWFKTLDETATAMLQEVCAEASTWFRAQRADSVNLPSNNATPSCKFEIASKDEAQIYEVFITPASVHGAEGMPNTVAAVVRDISQTRRMQQTMHAIDRAGHELVRLDADEIRKMNGLERLELVETKVVKYTRDLLHFDHFGIFLIDDHSKKLQLVISSGMPEEIKDVDLFIEADGSGISGYVATTGTSYICKDAQTDDRFIPGLVGARSSLTVPLMIHDKVIGIMDIESQQPNAFDEHDEQMVMIFARHVALALHMLGLLVVERSVTNRFISDRVEGELSEPLDDILQEMDWLQSCNDSSDPERAKHIARILDDVEAIRKRVKEVAAGPQTLLGVEKAMCVREKDPVLDGKRILVADDQAKIRKVIAAVLRHRGSTVTVCEDGVEAIAELERVHRDNDVEFDLILSDIQMPDRNGYEVFRAAQKCATKAPVLLMTGFGYDPHHSIVRASQEGLAGVLFKPFEVEELLDRVREAMTANADAENVETQNTASDPAI